MTIIGSPVPPIFAPNADDMAQQARMLLASQSDRLPPAPVAAPVFAQPQMPDDVQAYPNEGGPGAMVVNAIHSLFNLPKRALEASAQDVQHLGESGYEPQSVGPAVDTAMTMMGGGLATGVPIKSGETLLGAGVRPYANVPDSLMGFRKSGTQKGFDETSYPHAQDVEVTLPRTSYAPAETFVDQIKGMNPDHALERAWRNWPDAVHIQAGRK